MMVGLHPLPSLSPFLDDLSAPFHGNGTGLIPSRPFPRLQANHEILTLIRTFEVRCDRRYVVGPPPLSFPSSPASLLVSTCNISKTLQIEPSPVQRILESPVSMIGREASGATPLGQSPTRLQPSVRPGLKQTDAMVGAAWPMR